MSNYTIVSGLWDINREGRNFIDHYIPRFWEFLEIDAPMILFIPSYLEDETKKRRKGKKTFLKITELNDLKNNIYSPHWDKTLEIRRNGTWKNQKGKNGWLARSPQAKQMWYNPIVQSKMFFLHDASLYNTFNTEYFFWLDAGITNTVPKDDFITHRCLDLIVQYSNPWLFLSYPYEADGEIHGFDIKEMNRIVGQEVEYVCRGGLFGGHKEQIKEANNTYYHLLHNTLENGYMGTEESIFTLMAYAQPSTYRRYSLDNNGLICKFTENLLKNNITLEPTPTPTKEIKEFDINKIKTNLYILTFNFPDQLKYILESISETEDLITKPTIYVLDNSEEYNDEMLNISEDYLAQYKWLGGNTGICGGRQYAAEHFHTSDADYMLFFEDDMTFNLPEVEGTFCRNGFRCYVRNLYEIIHKIMIKEDFDFLKLSFTEVYWDNNIQTSWYNVPQEIRTRDWPHYDKLPLNGSDPNAPRTKFDRIDVVDGLGYITGEITYTNWPMIVSREGNKKIFIDTKWEHPYEQTWMSHAYQLTKENQLKPAVLLASPILHNRIVYYESEKRREN